MINSDKRGRIDLVDSLRGYALFAIVLLHNLEHYNLMYTPKGVPDWLTTLDTALWETIFFTMAGKAFSTFSLLFGFSLYIQSHNAQQRGDKFTGRFIWRMVILLMFALLHTIFYNGDILLLYAIVGIMVIPLNRLSNKTLLIIGTILFIQPLEWSRVIYAYLNPDYQLTAQLNWKYWPLMYQAMEHGTFIDAVKSNLTDGFLGNTLWQIENGRLFMVPALFIFGILLGRMEHFVKSAKSIKFWKRVFLVAFIVSIPLYILKTNIPNYITNTAIKLPYTTAISSILNGTFMATLIAIFSLLWFKKGDGYRVQRFIIPYGRMSLTNYISQSIIGVFIYLNFGLGMYKYCGATLSTLIAIGIFTLQLLFSRWWLNRHKQGAFEYIWKRLTWINKGVNL